MNAFVSTTTGFSSYELVFLKKHPDVLNLSFAPPETVAKGYRDYCIKMRAKLGNVSNFITDLKTFQQQCQTQEQNTQGKLPENISNRPTCLSPSSFCSLITNKHKEVSC